MKAKTILALLMLVATAAAWGNGFSVQNNPTFASAANKWVRMDMYGTHDYLAQAALQFLPLEERAWVQNNTYFYGTELPDSTGLPDSIGDRSAQFLRFDSLGNMVNDSLALRAADKFDNLINALKSNTDVTASKWAGVIASYVSDAGLFSRVIDSENGYTFEGYMQQMTQITYPSQKFEEKFGSYITFDGQLEMISPYDAVMRVGQAAYAGKDGCSAQWMEDNYDTEDPRFIACAGKGFNSIVNAIADVLHTAYQAGVKGKPYTEHAYDWENYVEAPAQPEAPQPPAQSKPPVQPRQPDGTGNLSGKVTVPRLREDNTLWMYAVIIVILAAMAFVALRILGHKKGEGRAKALTEKPQKKAPKVKKEKKTKKAKATLAKPAARKGGKSSAFKRAEKVKAAVTQPPNWTEEEEEVEGKPEEAP